MKIAEVSGKYGLSADTLRYYERVGLIPPVNRNDGGIRDYNELDLRKCFKSHVATILSIRRILAM
jgi:DNA-binding transcriptional MerR regulator